MPPKKRSSGNLVIVDHGEHPDERWLVTYADLMTLLVALFTIATVVLVGLRWPDVPSKSC